MQKQPHDFRAETVDEQIDHFLQAATSTPTGYVLRDLQGLYERGDTPEQVRRSLDTIWARLSDHLSPEHQTLVSPPETDPQRALPGEKEQQARKPFSDSKQPFQEHARSQSGSSSRTAELEMNTLQGRPRARNSGKRKLRRTFAMSTLAAVVLLGVFSWVLVSRLNAQSGSKLGSGPGTPPPTIPATPAPQSQRDQARQLVAQFHQEVTTWGQAHQYHDAYDGKSYQLDYAYDQQGIGGVLDHLLAQAQSSADYQLIIGLTQNERANLHAMESTATDQTPWNQMHSSDSILLNHYKLTSGTVIVVSLLEQSMRVYQKRQLVKAFQVTTGGYASPSLPGSWQVFSRQSPTTLVSAYPKGSPYWFPPTPVKYALGYHPQGYLIYDSWWRMVYGSGSNFPYKSDPNGNSYPNSGSTGGIDLSTNDMAWLYANVQLNTPVVIY